MKDSAFLPELTDEDLKQIQGKYIKSQVRTKIDHLADSGTREKYMAALIQGLFLSLSNFAKAIQLSTSFTDLQQNLANDPHVGLLLQAREQIDSGNQKLTVTPEQIGKSLEITHQIAEILEHKEQFQMKNYSTNQEEA